MEHFLPGNDYNTQEAVRSFFPSFSFYRKALSIVIANGLRAKYSPPYTAYDWASSSFEIFKALESVGVRFEISGMNYMSEMNDKPCVFVGNHMSTLETFILPAIIQPRLDTTFVVKQSLVDYPVFKHVLRSRNPILVNRSNPREDLQAVLVGGEERLKSNRSIIVFPQSTRSSGVTPEHFNSIGVKLAKRAGVPVIPIALKTDAWGNGSLIRDAGKISPSLPVHIAFGKPFLIEGNGKKEHLDVIQFILEHLAKWQQADTDRTA